MSGIRFPIISDNAGELSRVMGVFNTETQAACRALLIINAQFRLVHLTLKNEQTFSNTDSVLNLVLHLQGREEMQVSSW